MLKEKMKKTLIICLAFLMLFMQGCIDETDNDSKNGITSNSAASLYDREDYVDTDEEENITDEEVIESEETKQTLLPEYDAEETDEETEEPEDIVYITDTGECYHRESCYHLKSKHEITLSRAQALGLRPCSRCNPPE